MIVVVYPNTTLQGKKMAYQKVNADQRAMRHSQYLDNDDLQATALDLEWDMEKELEEPGFDQFQLHSTENQNLEHSETVDLNLDPIQPATSPKGRFQRLQEEPDYVVTRYMRPVPKSNSFNFCRLLKIFCTTISLFIFGILIGYFTHKSCPQNAASSETVDFQSYQDILKMIEAEDIKKIFRNLIQLYKSDDDTEISKKIKSQWTSLGLEDLQFVNYSVLLNLPGPAPSSVTLSSGGQCFHPTGQPCDEEARKHSSQELLYSYAAYSAKGTLEAEVIDVNYGNAEDLRRIQKKNTTNKIALLKLGKLPLIYKLSLLEKAGFGGVLLYIDPCDLPRIENPSYDTFMVSLNPGGDPSTPGYPSIDGSFRKNQPNLTSLLVQPVSASLVQKLISSSKDKTKSGVCSPLELPSNEKIIINIQIQTISTFKTVTNVVGYLKGLTYPDRYIIVGSHHHTAYGYNRQEWASSTAIITAFIKALMLKVKKGWRPDRTIVFCSWGGTDFGNIGSFEWGENFKMVLQKNAVAYVSLHSPIRGNSSFYSVSSPSFQQLVAEKNHFNCSRGSQCLKTNVSIVQIPGDANYFINHLGVPTVQFAYEDIRALEGPSFLSEALFPKCATKIEEIDPSFKLHETITKVSGEVILQIANKPVLPVNALDIALEVQNSLKGDLPNTHQLLALASRLWENAELFQSDEMRPANDPSERVPIRVRMLNDILKDMEKNFLVQKVPAGFYRNILYHLDEKTRQFSILQEAWESLASNETFQEALSEVLNSINSAQVYLKEGLDVFESIVVGKN
ncbi:inactive N-acetylated-alpha-linked acidic dipeptidase-like protein 2 [Sorex araneus]|uniref:inactive N-acetylated-alpha-linked acidic dipeptidase-like protein 2 n=1 Tax=Sorex araneus TaxID=42254 RepID=UPI00243349A1|nr:inactive N-acetylated-alpha-linked acidic dipeptidase-like protein 2 [Sorex araneus]